VLGRHRLLCGDSTVRRAKYRPPSRGTASRPHSNRRGHRLPPCRRRENRCGYAPGGYALRRAIYRFPGFVAPRRVIIHTVRRIRDHQVRLAAAEHALDVRRHCAVAAEQSMTAEQPQIARLRHPAFFEQPLDPNAHAAGRRSRRRGRSSLPGRLVMRLERPERGDQYPGCGFLADMPPAPTLPRSDGGWLRKAPWTSCTGQPLAYPAVQKSGAAALTVPPSILAGADEVIEPQATRARKAGLKFRKDASFFTLSKRKGLPHLSGHLAERSGATRAPGRGAGRLMGARPPSLALRRQHSAACQI
jgi:hypothetical protein